MRRKGRIRDRAWRAVLLASCALVGRTARAQSMDDLVAQARATASRGDGAGAAALYARAVARDSNAVAPLRELTSLLAGLGRWKDAVAPARRLATLGALDASGERDLGQWLTWSGARDSGLVHLRRAVAAAPDSVGMRIALGQILTWDGRTRDEGIAQLRTALARDPARDDAARALAAVLSWSTATRGEAMSRYRALVARHPDDALLATEFGEILSWTPATRRDAQSMLDLARRRASATNDTAVANRAARSSMHLAQWTGHPLLALAIADSLLARAPSDTTALAGKAAALSALHRDADAVAILARLHIQSPSSAPLREQLAYALAASGRWRDARAVADSLPVGAAPNARDWIRRGEAVSTGVDASVTGNSFGLTLTRVTISASTRIAPRTRLTAYGRPTWFRAPGGDFQSQSFGGGLDFSVPSLSAARVEAGADRYSGAPDEWSGAAEIAKTFRTNGEARVSIRRSAVEDSRRSARGVEAAGTVLGQVRANVASVSLRTPTLPLGLQFGATASLGDYTARSLRTNLRRDGSLALDRDQPLGAITTLRIGIGVSYLGYSYDANRPANVAPANELGGYWSPRAFGSTFARTQLTVTPTGRLTISGGGAANYLTSGASVGARRSSVSLNGSVRWVEAHGWDLNAGGFYIDNFAEFRMNQVGVGVRHAF